MAKSKREIDKEVMFQKIMPTGMRTAAPEEGEPAPERAPEPSKPTRSSVIPDSPAQIGVQIQEKKSLVLVNIMERLVVEKLDAAFEKFNCCKCDKCRKDVAAIALNKLPPKYMVVDPNHIDAMMSFQNSTDVATAIVQAILQVRGKPRH